MLNVLIVDDEFHAQENTEIFIQKYFLGLLNVVGKCSDVREALVAIHNQEPDLVLLDIQMPNQSGLDLLDIVEPRNFDVIF
jgi:two-component system, LytTR family, response regulator